jgi:iron-sulfur cluster repair protein YtfE (RIC family)
MQTKAVVGNFQAVFVVHMLHTERVLFPQLEGGQVIGRLAAPILHITAPHRYTIYAFSDI